MKASAPTGREPGFIEIAKSRSVMRRALRIALAVGTVLAMINHGDALLAGTVSSGVLFKIFLTFLVPYCVSTYSSVSAVRERRQVIEPAAGEG